MKRSGTPIPLALGVVEGSSVAGGHGFDKLSPNGCSPFALSLSKGRVARGHGFDKLSPNGCSPFALSLSKGRVARGQGFDKLSPNGVRFGGEA